MSFCLFIHVLGARFGYAVTCVLKNVIHSFMESQINVLPAYSGFPNPRELSGVGVVLAGQREKLYSAINHGAVDDSLSDISIANVSRVTYRTPCWSLSANLVDFRPTADC
jgi:hypothetical protein